MRRENNLPTRSHTEAWRWLAIALLVLAIAPFISASPAAAHPIVVQTLPEAGSGYAEPPVQIGLVLDEPVVVQNLTVRGRAQGLIATSAPSRSPDHRTVTVTPDQPLPEDNYTVHWQIMANDGDIVTGAFVFGVGVPTNSVAAPSVGDVGSSTVTALRWILFGGLAIALGGMVGNSMVRDRAQRAHHKDELELEVPRPWVLGGSVVGLVAVIGLGLAQYGLTRSQPGWLLLEASGFLLGVLAGIRLRSRPALAGMLLVIIAEAGRSHLNARSGWLGSVTIGAHLTVAALWVGVLAHLIRTAYRWRDTPRQIVAVFRRYALYALAGYVLVVGTGTVAAILVMPSWRELTSTTYGRILLIKLAAVAIVTALAFAARRGIRRPISSYRWRGLRFARLEIAMLVVVLLAAASLTAISPPSNARASYPPPVAEPATRVGTLAGQVSTGLIASDDGLQIRLHVPEANTESVTSYRVEGTATHPNGDTAALKLESCGTGCFTSPLRWHRGSTKIEVSIKADGWTGGAVKLIVPWPVREGEVSFQRMLDVMADQPEVRIRERVTSNTQRSEGMSSTLTVSGKELLATQPYRSGIVSTVAILNRADGRKTIGFALIAESIYVRMTVDETGRIHDEQISSPNHLINRTYSYPTRQ